MPRGSKPGERRGGRQKGVPNKANQDIRAAAQQYTIEALTTLVNIAMKGESEAARVSAAVHILDRAHGKPPQSVAVGGGETPVEMVMRWAQTASEATQDPSAKS